MPSFVSDPLIDIRAVLFDLDGTLVESSIDFVQMKRETINLCVSQGVDRDVLKGLDILNAVEHTLTTLPEDRRESFRDEAWRMLEDIELSYAKAASAKPFAGETLLELRRKGFKIAVVTRNCRRAVSAVMPLLPSVIDVILAREDVPRTKPDPLHLLAALDLLGVSGGQALMVGDHPMDICAGKAAGTKTVGLLFGQPPSYFDSENPDAVFPDMEALFNALFHTDC